MLAVASLAYLVMLAGLTIGPQPAGANGLLRTLADAFAESRLTAWITYPVLEFTANIALFVPAGVLVVLWIGALSSRTFPAVRRWWWLAAPTGLAVSGLIEGVQATLLADRVPDVRDLVSNTLGALVGAALAFGILAWMQRHAPRPRPTRPA